jgi:hypothetical protein
LWQESFSKEAHKRGAGNRFVSWQNIWCRRWFYLPIEKTNQSLLQLDDLKNVLR